jgi:hypothetical protein
MRMSMEMNSWAMENSAARKPIIEPSISMEPATSSPHAAQELVLDLHRWRQLQLPAEPYRGHHWATAMAHTSSNRATGIITGGTSQGFNRA